MTKALLADLEWRGLIAQTTDRAELEKALANPAALYLGIDPTAPSMHLGNLVVCLVLRRFQLAGHKPIPLVGGATGLVGDPSGRNEERSLNDESVVSDWVARIRKQLESIIDFDDKKSGAVLTNNLDWTKPVSALEFLRDIGKHFSVNQMLSKDSVSSRLEAGGISYTEFSYQVLQAFDYLELFRRHECILQIGGSDQWGNIVAGLDLIRKVEGGSAHALTVPLLVKSDGSKFGKTASGAIWLDPQMTSPYEFFQFWLNSDDADMPKLLKVFSMKDHAEISRLIETVKENPGAREAHRALAQEMTTMIHGQKASEMAEMAAKALFGQGDIAELDLATLDSALAQLPRVELMKNQQIPSWVDLLAGSGVVDSKSAARRIVKEGGAYLNNQKVSAEDFTPGKGDFLHGKYLLLRKGKRDLAAVVLL
ncbi:MAG: tyrosine--tRNA ligase [Actinobacteria bacterium]|jgi:tyrosyl-tRNA synthetase|uniref:tyrosine--tRNA ligase n=1 Tax=freshwater metagenome TaxID=449393 RepID=A0A6J7W9W3_9ZZZZ|nr:tyrosine--tRNA ligase [Actinomycetota bacterium]MSV65483.1 tyrosine--tRNA ligase [Actinomycetota bacterium]MSX49650.1 tyrosine--tRNA ligase [Actinomycetota bacterium]MSY15497.1 tyrosine--tRNA ligase [Actinomycetota bacterium]MSY65409.1 tyrosine--tRNA ligase [Actinomycetota bacterium]